MFEKKNEFTVLLTMRQISLAVAGLLALSFFIFITGYFLGKKKAIQEFSYHVDQDSLADQIYSSMCVLYDAKDDNEEDEENVEENEVSNSITPEVVQKVVDNKKSYHLTLAGFSAGQQQEATKMVARLAKQGFSATVNEIPSKTSKGATITWYQVVAQIMVPETELEVTTQKIAKFAHVNKKSIRIDECA